MTLAHQEHSLLHVIGIYFFTKGFLLTRLVLDEKSLCSLPPLELKEHGDCWYPKQFDKAVIIIIDALRYDFTVPNNESQHYLNALHVLHETASSSPNNAFLLPFISDAPTATLQRLKGLTTGTLPTFVDLGSNFAGTAIEEDNLVAQLKSANKTLVHLGDDTWHALFPGHFDANLTRAYDSFNVWDLHTVDNGVVEHIMPLLRDSKRWDVIFGHFLGVDHAGHRYGPDHAAMGAKLHQMDDVLRQIIAALDNDTLLVVMGDHGMDAKGDHGGESDDEVEAALWMYSKKGTFGRSRPEFRAPPATAKSRAIPQIDLVPTLALLLGLPIPFNNLGAPIEEVFIGKDGNQWEQLASVQAITAAQVERYQREYDKIRGVETVQTTSYLFWEKAMSLWKGHHSKKPGTSFFKTISASYSEYLRDNLRTCKSMWASFNIPSMIVGIGILISTIVGLILFARSISGDTSLIIPSLLRHAGIGGFAGVGFGATLKFAVQDITLLDFCLGGFAIGTLLGLAVSYARLAKFRAFPLPMDVWAWASFIFTIAPSIGFASNSYTIWEDEILLFFLSSFAVLSFGSSFRLENYTNRLLGTYHSAIFLLLTRLASLSRLCREEQMPYCRSTYYASSTSSTSATWQLFIPFVLAIILPGIIKSFYTGTRSYEGSAAFWVGFAFRLGLLGSAVYWTLDAADNGEWLSVSTDTLASVKTMVAQIVLAVAFAAGTTTFVWAPPCVRIESTGGDENEPSSQPKRVTILGYANVHGSRYALLVTVWLLAIILVQKPMGGGALGLMAWQMFSLLEVIDTNDLSQSSIGPIILGLLGNFYFFKTGHQATLASIQWDSAFVALKTLRYPWSPFLVMLNTFGAQMLAAVFVPLVVLWKQQPKKSGLLSDVTKALATHISFYAVLNLTTTMWAGWLRRHLMLYRIFSPRFMTGAAVLLVVDIIGIFVALGGFRWNTVGVSEVFGWP